MSPKLGPLNCAGCRICCLGDTVFLRPGENPHQWKTRTRPDGRKVLAKGKDGNCVYLGKRGCQIWMKPRPLDCMELDCRKYAPAVEAMDAETKALHLDRPHARSVIEEGRKRLSLTTQTAA